MLNIPGSERRTPTEAAAKAALVVILRHVSSTQSELGSETSQRDNKMILYCFVVACRYATEAVFLEAVELSYYLTECRRMRRQRP